MDLVVRGLVWLAAFTWRDGVRVHPGSSGIRTSFLSLAGLCSTWWIDHIVYPLVDRHMGCFHFSAVTNNVAVNILGSFCVDRCFLFFFFSPPKIYLFILERERESMCKQGEGQREKEKQTPLNREADAGLDPRTLKSWPELKSRVRRLNDWATQAPLDRGFHVVLFSFSSTALPHLPFLCCYFHNWYIFF